MADSLTVGVCVPTVREASIREFLEAWTPCWQKHDGSPIGIRLFVHEDNQRRTFQLSAPAHLQLRHTAHDDICTELGPSEWIIPRKSGACRSFPILLAWKAGCDYLLTLDDDCLPPAGAGDAFVETHLESFKRDRWFRTIAGDEPRGVPYERLGSIDVRLNHGLWLEVPDLDGPTALVRIREPKGAVLRGGHEVVPPGMAFPLCAMNVCYHRSLAPAAYNLLMGLDAVGLDRFDDIWSGLLLKRVLDYMGWYATSGEPFVRHVKMSDRFANLRREALGIQMHEHFWEFILDAPLAPGLPVAGAFKALAGRVRSFPDSFPALPCPPGYFPRLADAMIAWADLFEPPAV
jgi:hypothetical protein